MKTKNLSMLIALAFFVLSCVATISKPPSEESSLPTPDPGFQQNYSEDPYAIPVPRAVIEALAIEGVIGKFQYGLPDSYGPLLSAVDPSALEDVIEKLQHGVPGSSGPLLSAVDPSTMKNTTR